jgi:2-polyprenyl-3-methyl-5-hydroxy-6-metoxy-1,4-benzoquinol methylase
MKAFSTEAKYYDAFHSNKDYTKEATEIRRRYPKAKTVLEIGSGTGLMTIELEKLGFKVTGLEPSLAMTNIANTYHRMGTGGFKHVTIQEFAEMPILGKKYDLIIALYDVLNYVPRADIDKVFKKIEKLGKNSIVEIWPDQLVKPFTYKKVGNYRRIRLGFRFNKVAYLWYIYWGDGLVTSFHKLYFH